MAKDLRKKGCPDPQCIMNKKKQKFSADFNVCPVCGSQLVYVCANCFSRIEDIDSKHRICAVCDAKKYDRKEKQKKVVQKAGKAVLGAGVVVAVGILKNVKEGAQKTAVKEGSRLIKEHGPKIIKGIAEQIIRK